MALRIDRTGANRANRKGFIVQRKEKMDTHFCFKKLIKGADGLKLLQVLNSQVVFSLLC